ncbi:MAG: DeoR family transcriptional regulator [Acidobacteriaceae bacterium]
MVFASRTFDGCGRCWILLLRRPSRLPLRRINPVYAPRPTDRRAKDIPRLLLKQGKSCVEDLTAALATSSPGIWRDLVRLEESGLMHRTHARAMLSGSGAVYEPFRFATPFEVREDCFSAEKQRIVHAETPWMFRTTRRSSQASTQFHQSALNHLSQIAILRYAEVRSAQPQA